MADGADAVNSTYFVTNVDDPGDGSCDATCSLRDAITLANANPNHTIAFDIAGCPPACTISVASGLPDITGTGTHIDGTTEPNYAGTPIVIVDGTQAPEYGLSPFADNVVIEGLIVQNFPAGGINGAFIEKAGRRVENNIIRNNGTYGVTVGGAGYAVVDNVIQGNGSTGVGAAFAGNPTNLLVDGNEITGNGGYGVFSAFLNTTITDNVISGNGQSGIQSQGDGVTTITGNTVTDNVERGIYASGDTIEVRDNTATGNGSTGLLGVGPGTVTGNVITGNGFGFPPDADPGLELGGQAGMVVRRNEITGNAGQGVAVFNSDNTIGGASPEESNQISGNGGSGVFVQAGEEGNSLLGNSIHDNGGLGIDLGGPDQPDGVTPNDPLDEDTGANNRQNFPLLATAVPGSVTVTGGLNSRPLVEFLIEFFHNDSCDSSGFGEGEARVGSQTVTTDVAGNAVIQAFLANAPPSGFITATATNQGIGDTSEFSNCIPVAAVATPTPSPSPSATPTPGPTGRKQGDTDCSGVIDARDSLILFLFSAGLPLLSRGVDCPDLENGTPAFGDLNCDDVVDAQDGLGPLAFAAGVSFFQEANCTPLGSAL